MADYYEDNRFKRGRDRYINEQRSWPNDPGKPPGDIVRIKPEFAKPMKSLGGLDHVPHDTAYSNSRGTGWTVVGGVAEVIKVGWGIYDSYRKTLVANEIVKIREAAIEQLPAGEDYAIQIYNAGGEDQEVRIYKQKPSYGPGLWPKAHIRFERGSNKNPIISDKVVVYGGGKEGKLRFARVYDGTAADKEPTDITRHGGEVPADARFDHDYPVKNEPGGKIDPRGVA